MTILTIEKRDLKDPYYSTYIDDFLKLPNELERRKLVSETMSDINYIIQYRYAAFCYYYESTQADRL